MITCKLEIHQDVDSLYKIFLSEKLESDRAKCTVKKNKTLTIKIVAKDTTSMKAFVNSVLKIIEIYEKTEKIK